MVKENHKCKYHQFSLDSNKLTLQLNLHIFDSSFLHIYDNICRARPIQTALLAGPHNNIRFAIEDQNKRILYFYRLRGTFQQSLSGYKRNIRIKDVHLYLRIRKSHTSLD